MTVATERSIYAEYGRTLMIRALEGEDADEFFDRVCSEFENTKIEQDAQGNVFIMAPCGGESSHQNLTIGIQLGLWAVGDGRGRAFDSNALFLLPGGAKRGPDASWVSHDRLKTLSSGERRKFLRIVPEFVIELKSPSDRMTDLKEKMEEWRDNGVQLGWLIDPDAQVVLVYRHGAKGSQRLERATSIQGEGSVAGFTLDLLPVWQGLQF
jgi:Uma2 family endonuclease